MAGGEWTPPLDPYTGIIIPETHPDTGIIILYNRRIMNNKTLLCEISTSCFPNLFFWLHYNVRNNIVICEHKKFFHTSLVQLISRTSISVAHNLGWSLQHKDGILNIS